MKYVVLVRIITVIPHFL